MPKINNDIYPKIDVADILSSFSSIDDNVGRDVRFTTKDDSDTIHIAEPDTLLKMWIDGLPNELQPQAIQAAKEYVSIKHADLKTAIEEELKNRDISKLEEFFRNKIRYVQEKVRENVEHKDKLADDQLPYPTFNAFHTLILSYHSEQGRIINTALLKALEPGYQNALFFPLDGKGENFFQFLMCREAATKDIDYDPNKLLQRPPYQKLGGKSIKMDPSVLSQKQYLVGDEAALIHSFLRTNWEQPGELIAVPTYPPMQTESATKIKPTGILVVDNRGNVKYKDNIDQLVGCTKYISRELGDRKPFVYSDRFTK